MGHSLAEQRFANFEEVEKWLVEWFALKEKKFFWNGIHDLPERWAKCVESNGQYFEYKIFEIPLRIKCFLH